MAFYVDLTNVGENNYRLVRPNGLVDILDFTTTSGGVTGIDIRDPIDPYPQSGTPDSTGPDTTFPITFTDNSQQIVYNGNGNSEPTVTVDFENLNEVGTAQGGPGFLDLGAGNINIFRVFLDIRTETGGIPSGNSNTVTFSLNLRNPGSLVNIASSGTLSCSPASGINTYFFQTSLAAGVTGGYYGPNVQLNITQLSGGAGGSKSRRNYLNIYAVDWQANTRDLEVYRRFNQFVVT